MMNLKLREGRKAIRKELSKYLAIGFIAMCSIFMMGITSSLQAQSTFQSSDGVLELDKAGIVMVSDVFRAEIATLKAEMETQQPHVNGGKALTVGSPFQNSLIGAYQKIIRNMESGLSIQEQLLNVLQGRLFRGSDDGSTRATIPLTPAEKQELDEIISFVQNWHISNKDLSDLEEALLLIRELKN